MTAEEARELANIRLRLDAMLARHYAELPASNAGGGADLPYFVELDQAIHHRNTMESVTGGNWVIVSHPRGYVVERFTMTERPDTPKEG